MRTPESPGERAQPITVEGEAITQLLTDISKKMDDVTRSTNEIEADIDAIKARLFNGLTDTMRETYAKVIILENKHEETSHSVYTMHKQCVEQLKQYDNKYKVIHAIIGITISLVVITWSVMLVYKVTAAETINHIITEKQNPSNAAPTKDHGWSLMGP